MKKHIKRKQLIAKLSIPTLGIKEAIKHIDECKVDKVLYSDAFFKLSDALKAVEKVNLKIESLINDTY